MSAIRPSGTVVIHWPRFGPYHLARLRSADAALQPKGIQIIGLEVASRDEAYLWRQEDLGASMHRLVFTGRTYEEISPWEMFKGIHGALDSIRPAAIATNGYSTADAWALLIWCKLRRCRSILMTESKADDSPRIPWKEGIKRGIISQYAAALCGGTRHRAYLESLGMKSERIFDGYDAVDNDYFWNRAAQVRREPSAYRSLPGLESSIPYFLAVARFVKRKNLDGLLRAYAEYRQSVLSGHTESPPWRMVILGDGDERTALQDLVRDQNIEGVTFPGFHQIEDLPIYYGLAGAFVHPASQEQWGLVVNEAMAAGLPVLVSEKCGCAPDLVCQGQNGFTFAPEDMSTLAGLMELMSSERVDLERMGRAAHNHVQSWGLDRFAHGLSGALGVALRNEV